MRKNLTFTLLTMAFLAMTPFYGQAQLKLPAASTTQTITQDLGIKKLSLVYQRPNINDRLVFGGLVPFDDVWRTGANNATAITFEDEVEINGTMVPAGTYGLFTIPGRDQWTIILNKTANQWGSYEYKQEDDLLRFNVTPEHLNDKVETFTINFEDIKPNSLVVALTWENTKVKFPIVVDQSREIMAAIEEAMKGERKPYFQAAQYYHNNNLDSQKAASWIIEADKDNSRAPHIKYWKSRILLKSGDKAGAAKAAQEGIAMATELNNTEYITLNTQALEATK